MKGMIEWFACNGVAANLMMVFILVSGIIAVILDGLQRTM